MKTLLLILSVVILSSGDTFAWATCTTDAECAAVKVSFCQIMLATGYEARDEETETVFEVCGP